MASLQRVLFSSMKISLCRQRCQLSHYSTLSYFIAELCPKRILPFRSDMIQPSALASSRLASTYVMHVSRLLEAENSISDNGSKIQTFSFVTYSKEKPTTQPCWKCGSEISRQSEQYFCKCGMIQPPVPDRNFFDVFGFAEDFVLDTSKLQEKFRDLQKNLHPDKFAQKSETEKAFSAQQSATINQAYRTLLNPLSRGLYLLEICGAPLQENEIQMDPEFLMEIMELNEEIVELESESLLMEIYEENQMILKELIKKVSDAFQADNFSEAKTVLARMKYYVNIDEKVKDALQHHGKHLV